MRKDARLSGHLLFDKYYKRVKMKITTYGERTGKGKNKTID